MQILTALIYRADKVKYAVGGRGGCVVPPVFVHNTEIKLQTSQRHRLPIMNPEFTSPPTTHLAPHPPVHSYSSHSLFLSFRRKHLDNNFRRVGRKKGDVR